MADYTRTVTLMTDADTAYRWLSDVSNLPKYFRHVTSATVAERKADTEEVHVSAEGEEDAEAWFRTNDAARRLEWGSEAEGHDYHGWLKVSPVEGGSAVTLGIHTSHDDLDDSIGAALDNLRREIDES